MMLKQSGSKDDLGADAFLLGTELAIHLDRMIGEQDQEAVAGDGEDELVVPGRLEVAVESGDGQNIYGEITISEARAFAQALLDLSDTAERAGDSSFP
jgi:hypothetical protein